jgi:hypothetical protein
MIWLHGIFLVLSFQILESTHLYLNIVTSIQNIQRFSSYRPQFDHHLDFTHSADCFLQFVGYIETTLDHEIYWISGDGLLSSENDQNSPKFFSNCSYVTVTGVEANHQMVCSLHFFIFFSFL